MYMVIDNILSRITGGHQLDVLLAIGNQVEHKQQLHIIIVFGTQVITTLISHYSIAQYLMIQILMVLSTQF